MANPLDFNNNTDTLSQQEIDSIVEEFRNSFQAGSTDTAHIVMFYPHERKEFAVFISGNVGKLISLVQEALEQDEDLRQVFITAMVRHSAERVNKLQAVLLDDNNTNNQTIN